MILSITIRNIKFKTKFLKCHDSQDSFTLIFFFCLESFLCFSFEYVNMGAFQTLNKYEIWHFEIVDESGIV